MVPAQVTSQLRVGRVAGAVCASQLGSASEIRGVCILRPV